MLAVKELGVWYNFDAQDSKMQQKSELETIQKQV